MPGLGSMGARTSMPRSDAYIRRVRAYGVERKAYFRQAAATHTGLGFGLNRKYPDLFTAQQKRWHAKGRLEARKSRSGRQAWVKGAPAINQHLMRVAGELFPELAAAYDRQLATFAEDVFSRWPERTGYSKSMLILSYKYALGNFIGSFSSYAPYTLYIKTAAVHEDVRAPDGTLIKRILRGPRIPVYKRWVEKPGNQIAKDIAADLERKFGRGSGLRTAGWI